MDGGTGIRFLRSTVASYASLLGKLAIAFGARLVLARLLLPEAHGLYELALRIVMVAAAVRDLGLPFHLMRDPRRPYGTVLAFSLGQGVLVTLLLLVVAPATAALDPELPRVLMVLAPWVLLDGLVVVPRTFFERELRIGRLAGPEVARSAVLAVVSVGLAWLGWGVWSFVAGDLAATALFAAAVWWRARGRFPLAPDLSLVPSMLRQSIWLFAIWVVLQLVAYVDVFIVGAFASTAMVGQYARAYMVAFLVPQIVSSRALLPALVEYRDDPARFLLAFRAANAIQLSLQVVAGWFLFWNAERTVAILLGASWDPAVPLLRVLCFVPFLDLFTDLGGEVLKVRHEDRLWLATALLNLASLVGFGIATTARWGPVGMAWANFLLLGNLLMAWRMAAVFGPGFRRLMGDLGWIYLVPLPAFALVAAATAAGSWARFLLSGVAAALALAVLAARFRGPLGSFFREA